MSKGELIHVQLTYEEGLEAKKDILQSQLDLLKTLKAVKRYQALRVEELKIKIKLQKKIKEFLTQIRKMEKYLPKVETQKVEEIKEEKITPKSRLRERTVKERIELIDSQKFPSIEEELEAINRKLAALNKRN